MRAFALAAFLALSSCSASPVFAQECVSAERILEQLEPVKAAGTSVVTYGRDDAAKVLAYMADLGSPYPEPKVDGIILVVGDRAAMLLFIDGDKICRNLTIPLKAALLLDHAVRGRSV
jgi:hypothetical protein